MLLTTVRTRRFGRQSLRSSLREGNSACSMICSSLGGRVARGAATDNASVSAIFAACFGSQKQAGGSGWGSSSKVFRVARIRQAFFVSRQPSPDKCTPRPCPGSRVRARPPSHSTTASSGGDFRPLGKGLDALGSRVASCCQFAADVSYDALDRIVRDRRIATLAQEHRSTLKRTRLRRKERDPFDQAGR